MKIRPEDLRIMVIGAHPDDADIYAGGIMLKYVEMGATVKMVSMTNGEKGHTTMQPAELAARRYRETQRAKEGFGIAEYLVLDHPDCELEVNLETRREVTRLLREFSPHVIFTHRTCDYHADHRAVATLIMDAAYLLRVPSWCPETPVARTYPAIYFLRDSFQYPRPLQPDLVVDVGPEMDRMLTALCAHESQFFEWMSFNRGLTEAVPEDLAGRKEYIGRHWLRPLKSRDALRFAARVAEVYGQERAAAIKYIEVFELSEYGSQPTADQLPQLFPFLDFQYLTEQP